MALYVGVTCLDWAADEVGLLEEAGHRHFLNDDVNWFGGGALQADGTRYGKGGDG